MRHYQSRLIEAIQTHGLRVSRYPSHWLHHVSRSPLLHKHSLLLIVTCWAVLMAAGGVALVSIVSLGPEPNPHETSITLTRQPPRFHNPRGDALPAWSLAAIALSCAWGSVLITSRLRPRSPRRLLKRSSET